MVNPNLPKQLCVSKQHTLLQSHPRISCGNFENSKRSFSLQKKKKKRNLCLSILYLLNIRIAQLLQTFLLCLNLINFIHISMFFTHIAIHLIYNPC